MDPHWFGLLDPDPHWEKSWIRFLTGIRIETDGDAQEPLHQLGFHIRAILLQPSVQVKLYYALDLMNC
jgi:hypothetical protein